MAGMWISYEVHRQVALGLWSLQATWLGAGKMHRLTGWVVAQGEKSAVRYLFRKGLEVNCRSRYVHLSWGAFERDNGQVENARELFKRGHLLNPQDAPILQVGHASVCRPEKVCAVHRLEACMHSKPLQAFCCWSETARSITEDDQYDRCLEESTAVTTAVWGGQTVQGLTAK